MRNGKNRVLTFDDSSVKGVISARTVTGTSYLTKLTLAADAVVEAPGGKKPTMTVDGTVTAVAAGQTYAGAITPTVG